MIFLPLVVGLIVFLIPLNPYHKIGIIILSLCPGGATSNFISYILKLDTALSISLTSINSILILITIPIGANIALTIFLNEGQQIVLPVSSTIFNVLIVVLLPALLGVWFNSNFEKVSSKIQLFLKITNIILLGLVFGIKFFGNEKSGGSGINFDDIKILLPITLVIHTTTMIISYFISRKFLINISRAVTIGIEVGLQNTTLALLVTGTILKNNEMTKPALVYAIFSFFTSLLFGYIAGRRRNKKLIIKP
jgi:BASS family bile acid:Na+ symporter